MMSTWMYNCRLGLQQGTCQRYEVDSSARGYGRFSGCPSCCQRVAANLDTRLSDMLHTPIQRNIQQCNISEGQAERKAEHAT